MNVLKLTAVTCLVALVGCNSSGGGSDSAPQTGAKPSLPDHNPIETVGSESPLTTADIVAPEGLAFVSHKQMKLRVDLSDHGHSLAYLSVYSGYSGGEDQGWQINYDSRLLGSSVTSERISEQITVPQHLQKVLVQIWFYDTSLKPVTWEVDVQPLVSL